MRSASSTLLVFASAALFAACSVERAIPIERYACGHGGPCTPDAAEAPDADEVRPDAGPNPDAAEVRDAEGLDAFAPDAAPIPDSGLPVESCATATPLPLTGKASGDSTQERDDHQATCTPTPGGRDVVFWFASPGRIADLTVTSVGSAFDTVVALYGEACTRAAELACDDDGALVDLAALIQLHDLPAGGYYVVVDGWDNTALGGYALDVHGTLAVGEPCDPAQLFLDCGLGSCGDDGAGTLRCLAPLDCADGFDADHDGRTDEDAAACVGAPTLTCPASSTVTTGDVVPLTATVVGGAGRLRDERWSIEASPAVAFPPALAGGATATATLTPSLAGDYRLRYTVIDRDRNAVACETTVTAQTRGDLLVEMFWTPAPGAEDADFDLHLLDDLATRWFDPLHDCDAASCTGGLGWGEVGVGDDPIHGGNVATGRGPESARIPAPVRGVPYRIGVYYAFDGFAGPGEAYVRVHCNGRLAAELGPVTLVLGDLDDPDGLNSFWLAADVTFDARTCTVQPLLNPAGRALVVTSSTARVER